MIGCPPLAATAGLATALRSVDCQAGAATAFAFSRLFGTDGRLLPALTLLLTLYVAFFAIGLLTGRTRIGIGALTPRMLTLGLVLTFATSWAAYQNVVWTLATAAPDQIAGIVTGSHGPATTLFAEHLDRLFALVGEAADQAGRPAPATETGVTPATAMVGGFTVATVLSVSSVMLLLGTVGVLVTSKIALAALLAVGPAFIVLALFGGTRGLFEGWLRAVVLFAAVPLLAVLIGGGALLALEPVARSIALEGSQPSTRSVGILFLGASVYLALMVMALKTAAALVAGWRIPGHADRPDRSVAPTGDGRTTGAAHSAGRPARFGVADAAPGDDRIRTIVAGLAPRQNGGRIAGPAASGRAAEIVTLDGRAIVRPQAAARAHGVGSRFRPQPTSICPRRLT